MELTLRKGHSSVYLQYENGGDSIGADHFVVSLQGCVAVLKFRLRPVDSNQRIDERRLQSECLKEIHISDGYALNKLSSFLNSKNVAAQSFAVEISSLDKVLRFPIEFGAAGLGFLPLLVQRDADKNLS